MRRRIRPDAVIEVLTSAGVRFMLAGAYAIGGWTGRPRATLDVDVLVPLRQIRKAAAAIQKGFPRLIMRDTPVVIRFVDPKLNTAVIDIMKPNQPLFYGVFKFGFRVSVKKKSYLIPGLELALAMKFAAMVSPFREREKKLIDGADFMAMAKRNPDVNLVKLASLGERVYRGGGKEIADLLRKARSDEPMQF